MYIDKLDDIVSKYNNRYHRTSKMKPGDVKARKYISSSKEIIDEYSKFKIGDIVIPKYKTFLQKAMLWQNWSEEIF